MDVRTLAALACLVCACSGETTPSASCKVRGDCAQDLVCYCDAKTAAEFYVVDNRTCPSGGQCLPLAEATERNRAAWKAYGDDKFVDCDELAKHVVGLISATKPVDVELSRKMFVRKCKQAEFTKEQESCILAATSMEAFETCVSR